MRGGCSLGTTRVRSRLAQEGRTPRWNENPGASRALPGVTVPERMRCPSMTCTPSALRSAMSHPAPVGLDAVGFFLKVGTNQTRPVPSGLCSWDCVRFGTAPACAEVPMFMWGSCSLDDGPEPNDPLLEAQARKAAVP